MTRQLDNGAIPPHRTNSPPQTVRVEICNHVYTIRADGNHEYLIGLAAFVDRKMREIASTTPTVDSVKVAVLAALNIADELHRLKAQSEQADAHWPSRSAQYVQ